MDIAVVEDISEWAEKVEDEIRKILGSKEAKVEIYASAEEFLKARKKFQIVFMDIRNSKEKGDILYNKRKLYNK